MLKLKFILVLIATLLCFEMLVRLFVVSPAVVRFDSALGPVKAVGSHVVRSYEGHSDEVYDGYGFNNDALPPLMPSQRLLILGDSFVEAEQVPRHENFVSRLNALSYLFAYNAGYSGADPRSFSTLVSGLVSVIHPTTLVLCVNADDFSSLRGAKLPSHAQPKGLKLWLQPLFAHSALATHLNWKYKPILQAWWKRWKLKFSKGKPTALAYQHQQLQRLSWAAILKQLKAYHVPIYVVPFPAIHYEPNRRAVAVKDIRLEQLVMVAKEQGIPVLRMEPLFIRDFQDTGKVAFGFMNSHLGTGHLNEHGHLLVARAIMQNLGLNP